MSRKSCVIVDAVCTVADRICGNDRQDDDKDEK